MAKKEEKRSFMQIPFAKDVPKMRSVKVNWGGLNKKYTIDTGQLSSAININPGGFPYLEPRKRIKPYITYQNTGNYSLMAQSDFAVESNYGGVLTGYNISGVSPNDLKYISIKGNYGVFGFDDYLFTHHKVEDSYNDGQDGRIYTIQHKNNGESTDKPIHNIYGSDTDDAKMKCFLLFKGRVFVYPDNRSTSSILPSSSALTASSRSSLDFYALQAVVQNNRIVGVNGQTSGSSSTELQGTNIIAVSEFDGSIFEWGTESSDAWYSYTDENSAFVGVVAYKEIIIAFKRNFTYVLTGTKNPYYQVTKILDKGCADMNTVCEVNGYIYFLSDDGVNMFNGSSTRVVSEAIDLKSVKATSGIKAVAGTDGINYYLSCYLTDNSLHMYVYNTRNDIWSEYDIWTNYDVLSYFGATASKFHIVQFARNDNGLFFTTDEPRPTVWQINTDNALTIDPTDYDNGTLTVLDRLTAADPGVEDTDYIKRTFRDAVKWEAVTDFVTNNTVNIKHIRKIQILADIFRSSELTISIEYDNSGIWNEVYKKEPEKITVGGEIVDLPASHENNTLEREKIIITPKKSSNYGYKIKISGIGYAKVYQMEIITSAGGDLYV